MRRPITRFLLLLAAAMLTAGPAAAQTGLGPPAPWLAMLVSFGGLSLVILIVGLWGAGRGPAAKLDKLGGGEHHGPGHDHTAEDGHAEGEDGEAADPAPDAQDASAH